MDEIGHEMGVDDEKAGAQGKVSRGDAPKRKGAQRAFGSPLRSHASPPPAMGVDFVRPGGDVSVGKLAHVPGATALEQRVGGGQHAKHESAEEHEGGTPPLERNEELGERNDQQHAASLPHRGQTDRRSAAAHEPVGYERAVTHEAEGPLAHGDKKAVKEVELP